MTDLFHEWRTTSFNGKTIGSKVLNRPAFQFRTIDARYQELIYENTEHCSKYPKINRACYKPLVGKYGGPNEHQFMGSCIYSSIEINTIEDPTMRFISQQEVMDKAGIKSLAVSVPFKDPQTGRQVKVWSKKHKKLVTPTWIPDAVCGLEKTYPDGSKGYLMLIIQACRSTEGMRSFDFEKKGFLRDYLQTKEFLSTGMYRKFFKVKKVPALVLHVSARKPRIETMKSIIKEFTPQGSRFMLFQHAEGFDVRIKPKPVMDHLFSGAWEREGYEEYFINKI